MIGRTVSHYRILSTRGSGGIGHSVVPNIAFETGSINELSSSLGLKINLAGQSLLETNLLVRLNAGGLRDKISPLVGVEYAFDVGHPFKGCPTTTTITLW